MILDRYTSFQGYFSENRTRALDNHRELHAQFVRHFDEVIEKNQSFDFVGSKRNGTSIVLYFRAAKYLYTAHDLALAGHVQEARTLLRSVLELIIWAYLVRENDDVYGLWRECAEHKKANTDEHGNVPRPSNSSRYRIDTAISDSKELRQTDEILQRLVTERGEFAQYAHENLFDVAIRVDQTEEKTTIYVGNNAASSTMAGVLARTVELMDRIQTLTAKVRGE